MHAPTRRGWRRLSLAAGLVSIAVIAAVGISETAAADDGGVSDAPILGIWEVQSLNGINNNPFFPTIGSAGTRYLRIGSARYADGKSQMVTGPDPRYVSNRIYNDTNVNVFSERGVTQWGTVWGQFVDHNIGHRDENGTTSNLPFNSTDPLESFINDLGYIPFARSAAAPGTGVTNARQHINTQTAYLDAEAVYGITDTRLDWLRNGSLDGNPDNNSGTMMLPSNYLPRRDARGNPAGAPTMAMDGRLLADPNSAVVAGDVRANENVTLTGVQTLFAREHNRIVAALPSWVSQEDKYQLARAVVIAEIQYITYNEFLPAMGVILPTYQGYNEFLDPSTAHEFATVGYRAHSFIHGNTDVDTNASRYTQATLDALAAQGIQVTINGTDASFEVPVNVESFNPELLKLIQLGPLLQGVGNESQYRNDEMIDNQLRSVLFRIPTSSNPDCLDGPTLPQCFRAVLDLGAVDMQRGRDHGMPSYNSMRNAYGLASKTTFTSITGESTESFPSDPLLTPGNEINDPNCLDIVALFDINGNPTTIDANNATRVVKRCSVAARLKAIYGTVSNLDAFTGMMAEKHLTGADMGELQRAIWLDQFGAARDGDRFFYANDPLQDYIRQNFGIDSRKTLAQVISLNTDIPSTQLPANVFRLPGTSGLAAQTTTPEITAAPAVSNSTRHNTHVKGNSGGGGKPATVPANLTPRTLRRIGAHRPRVRRRQRRPLG